MSALIGFLKFIGWMALAVLGIVLTAPAALFFWAMLT